MSELLAALRPLVSPRDGMARVLDRPTWFLPLALIVVASGFCYSVYLVRASPGFLIDHEVAAQESSWMFRLIPEEDRPARSVELREYLRDTPAIVSHVDGWARLSVEWVLTLQLLTLVFAVLFRFRGDSLIPVRRALVNLGLTAALLLALAVWLGILWFVFGQQKIYFSLAAAFSTGVVLVFWLHSLFRLADDPDYRAYLGLVAHGLLVFLPVQAIGVLIAGVSPGLRVPFHRLVPRGLDGLTVGPEASGRLAGVIGSVDLFWLWFWLLLVVGLSVRTGWPKSRVAAVAMAPFAVWVAARLLWALAGP